MTDRNIDAIFGIQTDKPAAPAAPVARPHVGIPSKDTSAATAAHKDAAKLIENVDSAPIVAAPPTDGGRDINAILSAAPPSAASGAQKPWYESGTVPPNNGIFDGNLSQLGTAILGSQQVTNSPPQQPNMSAGLRDVNANLQNEQNVQNAAKTAQQQAQEQMAEAKAKHDQLEAEHRAAIARQRKAMLEHAHAQTLTPEEIYEQRQQAQRGQSRLQGPMVGEVPLKVMPVGGSGTAEYAQKFGATPEQALQVPSMSAMQKQNIPEIQRGVERASSLSGGSAFNRYEGAPNILLTEQAAREHLKPKMEAQASMEQRTAQDENERKQIARDLAKHKAGTKHALEVADLELKDAREQWRESQKAMAANKSSKPSATEAREAAKQQNVINELEAKRDALKADLNKRAPRMTVGGYDEYTNTFPIGNGAGDMGYATQLLQGIANPKMDAQSKILFQQELRKLEAKNPRLLTTLQQYYKP